tara:strand:- start:374 stop:517 length:144 start_codon:yes stop_codon:yes gene_type:complete
MNEHWYSVRDKHFRMISLSSAVRSSIVWNVKYVESRVCPCLFTIKMK